MTGTFDAWHLPGIEAGEMESLEVSTLVCRYPAPTVELVSRSIRQLREAGEGLKDRTAAELVDVIDSAAARLADPADPLRRTADQLVSAATGYSQEMTQLVLDRMVGDWRADRIRALLASEIGDPGVLDGFRPQRGGGRTRAYGPDLAYQVFAGNVPGVAVTAMIRALLVKAPTLGKLASGQPVLPVLFARALQAVDPGVARALAVTYWPGGSTEAERQVMEAADAVVVYGGEDAVSAYRGRIRDGTRLVVHGPRFSVGMIGADALNGDLSALAQTVARAVAVFDQHGCVSPHAVWIEDGGQATASDFVDALADALTGLEAELPRGQVSPAEASAIQQERAAAEIKGHAAGGAPTRVLAGAGTRWTVVLEPEPAFRVSCLNRFIRVHPVTDLDHVPGFLAPVGRLLQSVAIAGAGSRLPRIAHELARVGATRITSFELLPWPPPQWHHDGQEPLRELLRWVDLEA